MENPMREEDLLAAPHYQRWLNILGETAALYKEMDKLTTPRILFHFGEINLEAAKEISREKRTIQNIANTLHTLSMNKVLKPYCVPFTEENLEEVRQFFSGNMQLNNALAALCLSMGEGANKIEYSEKLGISRSKLISIRLDNAREELRQAVEAFVAVYKQQLPVNHPDKEQGKFSEEKWQRFIDANPMSQGKDIA